MVTSRVGLLACALLGAACATSSPPISGSQQNVVFESNQGQFAFEFVQDQIVRYDTLRITPVAAWAAIARAYQSAGLSGAVAREGTLTYGVPRATVRRSMGGVALSRLVRCGTTMGIPNADSYNVTLSVISRLTALGADRTIIASQVRAHAVSTGDSSNPIACVSTTELERRLANLLEYHAVHPSS